MRDNLKPANNKHARMGPSSGGLVRAHRSPASAENNYFQQRERATSRKRPQLGRLVELNAVLLLAAVASLSLSLSLSAAAPATNSSSSNYSNNIPPLSSSARAANSRQLKLSHHALCEPISQLEDLRLSCPHPEVQFIVFLEAYYSDLYPELACPKAQSELDLQKLTGSQLVSIFRQLYSPLSSSSSSLSSSQSQSSSSSKNQNLIKLNPTLGVGGASKTTFCYDDLKQSFMAKCSGQRQCQFSKSRDHQFPDCVRLKPGHVFARYLCIDDSLLLKYCNADTLLASHSTTLSRVRRSNEQQQQHHQIKRRQVFVGYEPDPSQHDKQVDTLDFGFVATPGYPSFYATSPNAKCGWTIEAELGQRVEIKLLDASMAPRKQRANGDNGPAPMDNSAAAAIADYSSFVPSGNPSTDKSRPQLRLTQNARSELIAKPYQQPNQIGLAARKSSEQDGTNVYYEKLPDQSRRTVFKIDESDYEQLQTQLKEKLQQVSEQCQGYDHLIVRDSLPAPYLTDEQSSSSSSLSQQQQQQQETLNSELDLISKLPITLYKNNLIDFSNQSIYHRRQSSSASLTLALASNDLLADQDTTDDSIISSSKRLDYSALLSGLNPLQLAWMYQHNVSLCSLSQQDELSSPQDKSRVSFRSSGNTIRLDLISGHMFNPLNRGVLFWYHKHGCPATRQAPPRTRLMFQNESTEIYRCFDGFVFADTRQSGRVKYCSELDQRWHDVAGPSQDDSDTHFPACVFVEELAYPPPPPPPPAPSTPSGPSSEPDGSSAKYDRLVATASSSSPQQQQHNSNRIFSAGNDVAVELVGVSTQSPHQQQQQQQNNNNFQPNHHQHLMEDVELLLASNSRAPNRNQPQYSSAAGPESSGGSFLNNLLDWMSSTASHRQPTGGGSDSNEVRSIMTHRPLREERLPGEKEATFWHKASTLFDRRLLAPAIALLFLFILLNFIIYVIFLVAIPKFARCVCPSLCSSGAAAKNKRKENACNGYHQHQHQHHYHDSSQASTKPFCHYESDYSVTMGMSL